MNAQPQAHAPNLGITPTTFENPMGINGFEFVEFAAPAGQGPAMADYLGKLGFTAVARHKHRPITLFRQGTINFLLNESAGSFAADFAAQHGPSACGFAIRFRKPSQEVLAHVLAHGGERQDHRADTRAVDAPVVKGIGDCMLYLVDDGRDDLYADFNLGFVLGFTRARGQHGYAVMLGEIAVTGVDIRLVTMRLGDAAAPLLARWRESETAPKVVAALNQADGTMGVPPVAKAGPAPTGPAALYELPARPDGPEGYTAVDGNWIDAGGPLTVPPPTPVPPEVLAILEPAMGAFNLMLSKGKAEAVWARWHWSKQFQPKDPGTLKAIRA